MKDWRFLTPCRPGREGLDFLTHITLIMAIEETFQTLTTREAAGFRTWAICRTRLRGKPPT
jgi:hypothetical protein